MIDMHRATLAVTIKDKVDKCSAPDSIRAMKGVQRKLLWVSKRAVSRILSDYGGKTILVTIVFLIHKHHARTRLSHLYRSGIEYHRFRPDW
jgi:hypothetical protein